MTSVSTTSEMQREPRLQGFGLAAVIAGLMLTLFLEALDQTIVGTAMPQIIEELHGLDRYSWVVTAYILASMTMIPLVGKLSDQFGRKWFLLGGTTLFLLGSVLAGASQSMDQLILFRGLQGLGAGIGMALIATVMADLFPPEERAKWGGLFGAVYGLSSLLGPTIGGWLTENGPLVSNLVGESTRWRWVFYINLPIGLVAMAALLIYLPSSAAASGRAGRASLRQIDFLGAALCAAGTVCVILGLTWGSERMAAWATPAVIGVLAAGAVLLALFLAVERRASEPILPLDLFRNQVFSVSVLVTLLQNMVLLGLALYLPLFLQGVLEVSPTGAGLVMTPFSISMVAGAVLSGMAVNRLGRYRIVAIAAALLMAIGALLIAQMNAATGVPLALGFMILTGVGIGAFFSLPTVAVQNTLPAGQLGVGTAAIRYLGLFGATLGVAIVGTVVASGVSGDLLSRLPATGADRLALTGALQQGFLAVFAFAVFALLATFFLKDQPLEQAAPASAAHGDAMPDEHALRVALSEH
jgi:EmrB/QacA subfamily drug resistance transporter